MPDLTHATRTLLRALSDLKEGTPVHADTVRHAFDAAELTSAERSGAFKTACTNGYLYAPHQHLADGRVAYFSVQSSAGSRKNAHSMLYARTAKAVPEHVCGANVVGAQGETRYDGGSKTAPGVASTTTGSLAHSEAAKPHGRTCIT